MVKNQRQKRRMVDKLIYVLEHLRERDFYDRLEEIKRDIGMIEQII